MMQIQGYRRTSSLPMEVSMIEEAKNSPVRDAGVGGIARCWIGLDSERAAQQQGTPQADKQQQEGGPGGAAAVESTHTLLAAAAADIAADPSDSGAASPPGRSDGPRSPSSRDRERTRAVNYIVCDSDQFRLLQSEIRSAGKVTDFGARAVIHSLVDEQMELMRRIQERKMRELEEEREAARSLAAAEGRLRHSPPSGRTQGPIKKDLLGVAIKGAQTLLAQARSAAVAKEGSAAEECVSYSAREMRKFGRSQSSPPSGSLRARRTQRAVVARGA